MAVRTREELLSSLNTMMGEETTDEVLAIIEDVTDTYDDLNSRIGTASEWEQKYHDNDAEWRQKYRERFMSDKPDDNIETNPLDKEVPETVVSYNDLFK